MSDDNTMLESPPIDSPVGGTEDSLLDRLEMPVEVRFGTLAWTLERALGIRVGDALKIGPDGDDAVTLYVQGRPYATGDLVVVDGRFAFRVREVAGATEDR